MRKLAVVAFGGNALLRSGQKGTYQEQIQNVEQTCESLCNLLERNYNIVIGHGNGPQVGISAWPRLRVLLPISLRWECAM